MDNSSLIYFGSELKPIIIKTNKIYLIQEIPNLITTPIAKINKIVTTLMIKAVFDLRMSGERKKLIMPRIAAIKIKFDAFM
jgi:hypothetical protein